MRSSTIVVNTNYPVNSKLDERNGRFCLMSYQHINFHNYLFGCDQVLHRHSLFRFFKCICTTLAGLLAGDYK